MASSLTNMALARRLRDHSKTLKEFNSDFCEECASAILEQISSNHKLTQGTTKSDVASYAASKRNSDKDIKSVDNRKVLLTITVEIEEGRVEQVQIKEGDSAETVAVQFCQEHGLPDQFVAPFTEHILSIINEEDRTNSNIMFPSPEASSTPSTDEYISTNGSSLRGGGSPTATTTTKHLLPTFVGSASSCCLPLVADRPPPRGRTASPGSRQHEKTSQAASQKVDKLMKTRCCCCGKPLPGSERKSSGRRRKKRGRMFSDRLMAPTFTSLAKNGALEQYCLKKKSKTRPLSEQQKAVAMRLYNEPIGHCHRNKRCRNGAKRTYRVSRRREGLLSKKSWLLSRMRGKIAKQYRNYGLMLYAEGLQQQENHIKAVHERAKQLERMELADVTLMPKISSRSRNMGRSRDHVWRRLQSGNRFQQDALQELRHQVWDARYMECTFRPQINSAWGTDGKNFDSDYYSDRFEQLFLDAECRRHRRAECMQWHPDGETFLPTINKPASNETSPMSDDDVKQARSVFHRLMDNAAAVMKKKQMQVELSHRPLDPRTGCKLFIPHIGRKPLNRNHAHLPIGEYLHRMNFAFNSKIRKLVARENRIKKDQARARYLGPRSQRLVDRLKDHGFQQLFNYLDTDKDGYVDLTTANFNRLNSDVVKDLERVMKMRGGCEKMGFETFEDLMLETEEKYHMGQQVHLGLKHRRHYGGDQCTFKFRMDKLSLRLAKERRKFSTHEQWWQIIFSEYIGNLQKIENWRKERHQQQMAECTFKPYLISEPEVAQKCPQSSAATPQSSSSKLQSLKDGMGQTLSQTITDIYEKVQKKVHENHREGYYLQNNRGACAKGSEVIETQGLQEMMETQQVMESPGKTNKVVVEAGFSVGRRKKRQDNISELDDLPKKNMGMFLGLMGA